VTGGRRSVSRARDGEAAPAHRAKPWSVTGVCVQARTLDGDRRDACCVRPSSSRRGRSPCPGSTSVPPACRGILSAPRAGEASQCDEDAVYPVDWAAGASRSSSVSMSPRSVPRRVALARWMASRERRSRERSLAASLGIRSLIRTRLTRARTRPPRQARRRAGGLAALPCVPGRSKPVVAAGGDVSRARRTAAHGRRASRVRTSSRRSLPSVGAARGNLRQRRQGGPAPARLEVRRCPRPVPVPLEGGHGEVHVPTNRLAGVVVSSSFMNERKPMPPSSVFRCSRSPRMATFVKLDDKRPRSWASPLRITAAAVCVAAAGTTRRPPTLDGLEDGPCPPRRGAALHRAGEHRDRLGVEGGYRTDRRLIPRHGASERGGPAAPGSPAWPPPRPPWWGPADRARPRARPAASGGRLGLPPVNRCSADGWNPTARSPARCVKHPACQGVVHRRGRPPATCRTRPLASRPRETRSSHTPACRWRRLPGIPAPQVVGCRVGFNPTPKGWHAHSRPVTWTFAGGPPGPRTPHLGIKSPLLYRMS
jgi:hypothetical protein